MTPEVIAAWGTVLSGLVLAMAGALVKVRRATQGDAPALRRENRRLRERNEQLVRALDEAGVPVPSWPKRRRAGKRREREA